jgi:uncharacterized protein
MTTSPDPPVSKAARAAIRARLDAFETEHAVSVLYACESGSRAWGFASTDSDYDVRVVYLRPRDWYLSIDLERRDDAVDVEIEDTPVGEVDLHAWDLRKALGLFRKSNPPLLEWLQSPIVYRETEAVLARWRVLVSEYYTPRAAGYHYLHMAQKIARRSLRDADMVPRKTYLYALRPLLAVRWIESERGPVPTEFQRLVEAGVRDENLRTAINRLLERKRSGEERDEAPRVPALDDFIGRELARLEDTRFHDPVERRPVGPLNEFFRWVLARSADRSD